MKLIPVPTRKHLYFTVVDDWLYDVLSRFEWRAITNGRSGKVYAAVRNPIDTTKMVHMSRLILGLTDTRKEVDHANQNALDNRSCNLRVATRTQNEWNKQPYKRNKSGYKGVILSRGSWRAQIQAYGIISYLGTFPTAEAAARAYDAEATKLHGEFAWLNFPDTGQHRSSY